MAFEQRDMSGSLFKNDRKEKDSHPDYTGNGMIDGRSYWFSAWIKKDKNGRSFMSLSFKPKDEKGDLREASGTTSRHDPRDELSDDIPF